MKKNKKWLLFLIVLFPSVFWLILESSTINSKKLPHFGPRSFNGTDTVYYSIGDLKLKEFRNGNYEIKLFDTVNYPIVVLSFIKESYVNENYRLEGLLDYTSHKKEDIDKMPVLLVNQFTPTETNNSPFNLKDSLHIGLNNIEQCYWNTNSFDSINFNFFREKPYYIDYSFFVLLDNKREIRGYYDGRYSAEIKRLLQEYKHLRIKEEKKLLIKENEITNEASH